MRVTRRARHTSGICLHSAALSLNLRVMQDAQSIRVPKWPFFLGDAAMLGLAYFIYYDTRGPLGHWEYGAFGICVALGAMLAVLPFLLDQRASVRQLDTIALGSVSEKISNLEKIAAQIDSATHQWESLQALAGKTAASAGEISWRMAAEVRDFTEFMAKANDAERATLRLEVEKLRRAESDWLQVLVRVLDHVHALHAGAVRSGQQKLVEQLAHFQNACREPARRVGLVPFGPAPGDPFDPQRHQTADGDAPPENALVEEVLAAGYTLQGQLVRRALVRAAAAQPLSATLVAQKDFPLETAGPA